MVLILGNEDAAARIAFEHRDLPVATRDLEIE
jgi:hypothetical protein